MTRIVIADLEINAELDKVATSNVVGGLDRRGSADRADPLIGFNFELEIQGHASGSGGEALFTGYSFDVKFEGK